MDAETKTVVVATLTALRELLGDETRWTQGSNARDRQDSQVNWDHPEACKFCLNGGLLKVSGYKSGEEYSHSFDMSERYLSKCSSELFDQGYVTVNDDRDHAAVVKVMDCAIKRAQDEPVA